MNQIRGESVGFLNILESSLLSPQKICRLINLWSFLLDNRDRIHSTSATYHFLHVLLLKICDILSLSKAKKKPNSPTFYNKQEYYMNMSSQFVRFLSRFRRKLIFNIPFNASNSAATNTPLQKKNSCLTKCN